MELDFESVTAFIAAHRNWAIPLLFLVSFAESMAFLSLLVPGTAILAACGALVPSGAVPLWALLAGAIPGAVAGDAVSYWIGWRYGQSITRCWPFTRYPDMVTKGEAFLARHGVASVAIGRFFGPVRAVIPLLAGIARMEPRKFWLANIGSAIVWAPVVMLPGAMLGWAAGQDWMPDWRILVAVLAVAGLVFLLFRLFRRA